MKLMKMENPWKKLRNEPPFVLDIDKNGKSNKLFEKDWIHTELPPEPYSGNKDAPLILLWDHPSFHSDDEKFMLKNENFRESMRKTREHEGQEYPFYHLHNHPDYEKNPGFKLWSGRLEELINAKGYKSCANSIFLIQHFPYKATKHMKSMENDLPSREYSVQLVKEAMCRDASIVVMSSKTLWEKAVCGLSGYKKFFHCSSCISPTISKGNIKDARGNLIDFNKILELISENGEKE